MILEDLRGQKKPRIFKEWGKPGTLETLKFQEDMEIYKIA